MALSQELQPPGPMVFLGPVHPSTQFMWQWRHSPFSAYLSVGQEETQKGPSLKCLQVVHLSGPGPLQDEPHCSWQRLHSKLFTRYNLQITIKMSVCLFIEKQMGNLPWYYAAIL